MTLREIFEKGKVADIRKMDLYGTCEICGKSIEEDEDVGFCGTSDDWNDYTNSYDHIGLDEELGNVVETETEVKADSYYDFSSDSPLRAEWSLTHSRWNSEKQKYENQRVYIFCCEKCYNAFMEKELEKEQSKGEKNYCVL